MLRTTSFSWDARVRSEYCMLCHCHDSCLPVLMSCLFRWAWSCSEENFLQMGEFPPGPGGLPYPGSVRGPARWQDAHQAARSPLWGKTGELQGRNYCNWSYLPVTLNGWMRARMICMWRREGPDDDQTQIQGRYCSWRGPQSNVAKTQTVFGMWSKVDSIKISAKWEKTSSNFSPPQTSCDPVLCIG